MIGTGKYNFPGIKKAGARTLQFVLASTAWGAALLKTPFKYLLDLGAAWCAEWLTNRGIVLINLTIITKDGIVDQAGFDSAMDEALEKVKIPGLTIEEKKAIDEKVRDAFRKFAHVSSEPTDP